MKKTLRDKVYSYIEPFLVNGICPPGAYKSIISRIHTQIVSDTIDAFEPNRVLQARPPLISPNEVLLPRLSRVTLT